MCGRGDRSVAATRRADDFDRCVAAARRAEDFDRCVAATTGCAGVERPGSVRRAQGDRRPTGRAHPDGVDDQRIGSVLRAVRVRRGLRQADVAEQARVSQAYISYVERGHLDDLKVAALRRIGSALDVQLVFDARWRAHELDRLLDAGHSALVEYAAGVLTELGWETSLEYGFNHYGDRGSVDIVAWRPDESALLIVEVKTRIADVQQLFESFGRKVRVVPGLIARERGCEVRAVGRLLIVAGTTSNRNSIERLRRSFDLTFPQRARELRPWFRRPIGPIGAIWFVSPITTRDGMQAARSRGRVRSHRERGSDRPPARS